jgi:hypothetical protein
MLMRTRSRFSVHRLRYLRNAVPDDSLDDATVTALSEAIDANDAGF